jgi:hypothetical protein
MANPAKDMILFPSGGMSAEDIGDSQKQNIALPIPAVGAPNDGDLPSIPGVSNFGEGPDVIQNKGPKVDKFDCTPAMPGADPKGGKY